MGVDFRTSFMYENMRHYDEDSAKISFRRKTKKKKQQATTTVAKNDVFNFTI